MFAYFGIAFRSCSWDSEIFTDKLHRLLNSHVLPSMATGEGRSLAACLTIVLIGPASLSCSPPLVCGMRIALGPASVSCSPGLPLPWGISNWDGCIRPSKFPPPNVPPARALGVPGEGVCRDATPPFPAAIWSRLSDVGMAMVWLLLGRVGVELTGTPPRCWGGAIWIPCTGMRVGPFPDWRIYRGCWEVRSYTACSRGVGIATEWVGVLMGGGAGEEVGVALRAPPTIREDWSTGVFPTVSASTCISRGTFYNNRANYVIKSREWLFNFIIMLLALAPGVKVI